jgi:hypothetical protein
VGPASSLAEAGITPSFQSWFQVWKTATDCGLSMVDCEPSSFITSPPAAQMDGQ